MPEKNEQLDSLVTARGYTRQKITKLCAKIDSDIDGLSPAEQSMYLSKAKALLAEITTQDKEIFNLCISLKYSAADLATRSGEDEEHSDKIALTISTIEFHSATENSLNNLNSTVVTGDYVNNYGPLGLKIPHVPLPEFGNSKGQNYQLFIKSFESMIEKHRFKDDVKFLYLRKQLSGSPKTLIQSLEVEERSYEKAKKLLASAFDNSDRSKHDLIGRLAGLKLQDNADAYPYISSMEALVEGFRLMKITIDDVLAYFIWNGLNSKFKNHITAITNKSKPNLSEIESNMFEASDRYEIELSESRNRGSKAERKSITDGGRNRPAKSADFSSDDDVNNSKLSEQNVNAVNIKPEKSKIFCVLCSHDKVDSDHYMKSCPKYETPRAKFDKLRSMRACTKCGFSNHDTAACVFKFKSNCRHCGVAHLSYLCLKAQPVNSNVIVNSDNDGSDVNSSLLLVEALQMSDDNPTILPTFTAEIHADSSIIPARIFKDGGCQRTFICRALAESLELPVIENNVPLRIHGFNSSRTIRTKIVDLKLKVGSQIFNHQAICVNSVRTKFSVDGLGPIIESFKSKGYKLADDNFSETTAGIVNNIDVILGTDGDHMLPLSYELYGDPVERDQMSCFISTPIGVILTGDVGRMRQNSEFLPSKVDTHSELKTLNSGENPSEASRSVCANAESTKKYDTVRPSNDKGAKISRGSPLRGLSGKGENAKILKGAITKPAQNQCDESNLSLPGKRSVSANNKGNLTRKSSRKPGGIPKDGSQSQEQKAIADESKF